MFDYNLQIYVRSHTEYVTIAQDSNYTCSSLTQENVCITANRLAQTGARVRKSGRLCHCSVT